MVRRNIFVVLLVISSVHSLSFTNEMVDILQQKHNDEIRRNAVPVASSIYRQFLKSLTGQFDPIHLPDLPPTTIKNVTISLSGLELTGLSTAQTSMDGIFGPRINLTADVPSLVLTAENYVAEGHFGTLPIYGNSTLKITVTNLKVSLEYDHQPKSGFFVPNYCVKPGTTSFLVDLDRLNVRFEDLNLGQDTGEVINSLLSSLGPDITAAVTDLLNGRYHEQADKLAVLTVNSALNKMHETRPNLFEECYVTKK